MAKFWTTTSQSEVGGTQAGDTHSVCTRAHGRAAAQRWLALGSCYSRPQADLQAKMDDWDQPNQAVLLGRLKCKTKRKLGPTDCRSGSVHVTTTPPLHADKDCLTTEENVTISSSRITRQGHCRSGAAESSLVATNHQPTKTRRPQRTTVDTRLTNSRIVESSGKRDR